MERGVLPSFAKHTAQTLLTSKPKGGCCCSPSFAVSVARSQSKFAVLTMPCAWDVVRACKVLDRSRSLPSFQCLE